MTIVCPGPVATSTSSGASISEQKGSSEVKYEIILCNTIQMKRPFFVAWGVGFTCNLFFLAFESATFQFSSTWVLNGWFSSIRTLKNHVHCLRDKIGKSFLK